MLPPPLSPTYPPKFETNIQARLQPTRVSLRQIFGPCPQSERCARPTRKRPFRWISISDPAFQPVGQSVTTPSGLTSLYANYAEAALLPYASLRFSCESLQTLEEFESKLKPVQRQAIKEPIHVGHGGKSRQSVTLDLSGQIRTAPR